MKVKVVTSFNTKSVALPFQILFDYDKERRIHLLAFRFLSFTVSFVVRSRNVD